MSLPTYVLGVDPGPIPGLVGLSFTGGRLCNAEVFQCSASAAPRLVGWLLEGAQPTARTLLAVERFVVGPRAARSSTPQAGQITRDLVGALQAVAETHPGPSGTWAFSSHSSGVPCVLRSASQVKPWATDRRLEAAGLLDPTKGMTHARDAARHALFAAVADCGLPDPLSRTGRDA